MSECLEDSSGSHFGEVGFKDEFEGLTKSIRGDGETEQDQQHHEQDRHQDSRRALDALLDTSENDTDGHHHENQVPADVGVTVCEEGSKGIADFIGIHAGKTLSQ